MYGICLSNQTGCNKTQLHVGCEKHNKVAHRPLIQIKLGNQRQPLRTRWNLDSGTLKVVRGYPDTSTPETKYYSREWTEAPLEPHTINYEGTGYGFMRRQTMIHNYLS